VTAVNTPSAHATAPAVNARYTEPSKNSAHANATASRIESCPLGNGRDAVRRMRASVVRSMQWFSALVPAAISVVPKTVCAMRSQSTGPREPR